MYNVVFKNIGENTSKGVVTWSTFQDKEKFDEWYDAEMRAWYQIVEEGVTQERAVELCSSPEATLAVITSKMRETVEILRQL